MAIALRKPDEIAKLRISNGLVAQTLNLLREHTKIGVSLKELDAMAEDFIRSHDAKPAFKGLYGFPSTVCTSVNEVIIHGIPTDYKLQDGDCVGLDLGVEKDGWFGDAAITVAVGNAAQEDLDMIACSHDALLHAVDIIHDGMRFKELSAALETFIKGRGFVPLKNFCGHGIGRKPHEEPEIPNYLDHGSAKSGPKIKNGMVFCIEPMICKENGISKILDDKWSVVSEDGFRGAHYEHTMAIIDKKAVILSQA